MQIINNQKEQILNPHNPVMLAEMLDCLKPEKGKRYLDCTFGAGGYSAAILSKADCYVTALDQDVSVQEYAKKVTKNFADKFNFIHVNFAAYAALEREMKYDGIVLDLGVSSMQLDQADRGFSFMNEGPLDMRMSSEGQSAMDFIRDASEKEIADTIYRYGEETLSRRIARNICKKRQQEPFETTLQLAQIVREAIGYRKGKIDPATKTFQAIRIHVNNELQNLENFLANTQNILNKDGKLIVVSFHSLEDAMTKHFFKKNSVKRVARSKYAKASLEEIETDKWLQILTDKPILPSVAEVAKNPRARSAKLRAAFKIREIYVS